MHWVVFSLGITNLVMGLAIYSSCRLLPMSRRFAGFTKSKAYQSFYRYHAVIWQVFWASVLVHIVIGSLHAGLPWMH
ncbi:MAG: hypothetical protein PHR56_05225 [Dehalococcoidales bacterium]|nr:hypothetical protein [Dehalococcoidales bacterium]